MIYRSIRALRRSRASLFRLRRQLLQSSHLRALRAQWETLAVQSPAVKAQSNAAESAAVKALRAGWMKKKAQLFAGKQHIPDSEDPDTVNHFDWYQSTNFTVPYPGETKVRPASDFRKKAPASDPDGD